MIINSLLKVIDESSLPFSRMHMVIPAGEFKVTIGMLDEKTYRWMEDSEVVTEIECSDIIDGVAHDVVVKFDTSDGSVELVDVK